MATNEVVTSDGPWAACLPLDASAAIATLRLRGDLRVGVNGDRLWLRGLRADDALQRALAHVAPTTIFSIGADDLLIAPGDRLPSGTLPALPWTPISDFVRVVPPPSHLAGAVEAGVPIHIVQGGHAKPANALLTTLAALARWIDDAPAFRLVPLRYAAAADAALVIGEPIPSLPGTRLYDSDGICVPCGWTLSPPVDAASLRSILSLDPSEVALFDEAGWHRIAADAFVPLSRASVRVTVAKRGGR